MMTMTTMTTMISINEILHCIEQLDQLAGFEYNSTSDSLTVSKKWVPAPAG